MYELNDISVEAEITGDKYPKIKVDLRTPLESAFWWLTVLSAASIAGAWVFSSGEKFAQQWPSIVAVSVIGQVVFGSLYFNTDNYYIFDLVSREMFYHFRFFFFTKVDFVARFEDIHAVTFSGRIDGGDQNVSYAYRVMCVLHTGQTLYLSDETNEDLEGHDKIARKISAITGADYLMGLPGHSAVAKRASDRFSFSFRECSEVDPPGGVALAIGAGSVYFAMAIALGKNGPAIIRFLKSIFG